ncbi:hypothetical protein [Vibrio ulleungensis]|uniref:Uncharacterized protein n=1 Tax=Vibrio ulleungensis TaxID=2807619 RepID=A0ABS2HI65_9VIBR|nr:hypothetical protein [Vibrio ulleungensis]MBM7035506.1 hypothetical protein [Vibrio ulleungensis]
MSSTLVLLTILVTGVIIGLLALYSPQLSKWSHDKVREAQKNKDQR